jgi:hypothetical protein
VIRVQRNSASECGTTGLGLACLLNDLCSLELNADWVFGEDYDAHAVSGRMIFEF